MKTPPFLGTAVLIVSLLPLAAADDTGSSPASEPAAGRVLRDLPQKVDPGEHYLIYLHGRIIEEEGIRPRHPRFGIYEYEQILQTLAENGLVVISEARPSGTSGAAYAEKVVRQVKGLIALGAEPQQITVVGFSKGGAIAIHASSLLADDRVGFVFLAACGRWIAHSPQLRPFGRILSLYEASDEIGGTCRPLLERRSGEVRSRETELHLGGGHGAFYQPHDAWIDPVVAWALGKTDADN